LADRRPNIVRAATVFYAVVIAGSCVYAFAFGHFDVLLGERAPDMTSLLQGVMLGLLIVGLSHLAHATLRSVRRASTMMARMLGPITVAQAIRLAVLSGFGEELAFRGALWPHLGVVGGAVLFGLLHTVPVRALAAYPIFAFLAGLVLGLLREQSGSLWPAVVCHFTVNALNLAWIGRQGRTQLTRPPRQHPDTPSEIAAQSELLPLDQEVSDDFPRTLWRYHLRLELDGTDRANLPDCLEGEELAIFAVVPREQVYAQLRDGVFVFQATFAEPLSPFPEDVAALSAYLFQVVTGVEVAERFVEDGTTDDARAWKITARRGEWVKVPLLVDESEPGRFDVDPDREDIEVIAAQWHSYPRWFQDGMRFKYPSLREL